MGKFTPENQPTPTERSERTPLTLDQEIALLRKKIALKEKKKRDIENGEKYVIGGMMLALARKDANIKKQLVAWLGAELSRPEDIRRAKPLIARLKDEQTAAAAPEKTAAAAAGQK